VQLEINLFDNKYFGATITFFVLLMLKIKNKDVM
jgi:hypothetical protein